MIATIFVYAVTQHPLRFLMDFALPFMVGHFIAKWMIWMGL